MILGLLMLPYLDANPAGCGYYAIRRRRVVYLVFQGILWLWILLTLIGTSCAARTGGFPRLMGLEIGQSSGMSSY